MRSPLLLCALLLTACAASGSDVVHVPREDGTTLRLDAERLVLDVDLRGDTLPAGWTVETGTWTPSAEGLVGAIDGSRAAAIWCGDRFPHDVALTFDAVVEPGHDRDANAFFNGAGTIYGAGEQGCWIVGIAGWSVHDDGLEKHPAGPAERVPAAPLSPGRPVSVTAGIQAGRVFLLRDGVPRLELDDPAPLDPVTHDRVGLGTWDSAVRFTRLRVWRLD